MERIEEALQKSRLTLRLCEESLASMQEAEPLVTQMQKEREEIANLVSQITGIQDKITGHKKAAEKLATRQKEEAPTRAEAVRQAEIVR